MPTVVTATAANVALELEGKFGAFVDKVSLPALLFPAAGQPTFGAFEARINVSSASALLDWAMSLARRKVAKAAGAVLVANHNFDLQRRIDWSAGPLTELALDPLDAREGKKPFAINVKWQPSAVKHSKGSGKVNSGVAKKAKAWLCSNFRLTMGGLPFDGKRVVRVELPTVKSKGQAKIGARRLAVTPEVEFGPLRLTVSGLGVDEAFAWVQKVQDHGGVLAGDRFDLSIEMLDATLAKVLGTIALKGCTLQSWEEPAFESASVAVRMAVLSFAVRGLDLVVAAA